jgi:MinD superfamily P-loop ATPase
MLAGAKATLSRRASAAELRQTLERVIEVSTACGLAQLGGGTSNVATGASSARYDLRDYGHKGVIVPFVGARGGAGRSTLSSSLAYLAAEAHIDTALIDFDLQFGDLNFLFAATSNMAGQQRASLHTSRQDEGSPREDDDLLTFLQEASEEHVSSRVAGSLRRFGRQLVPNLRLYAPRAAAEKVERLTHLLPAALENLRSEHELLLVNTGAYWTLFHAELLEQSDLAICVLDQTIVGVRATTELREICRRLGIPSARLLFVMNRAHSLGLHPSEAAEVLLTDKVYCVHDAGTELATLFDSGDFTHLLEQASFMAELYEILDEIAVRSDLCIHDALSLRFALRREGGTRLTNSSAAHRSASRKRGLLRRA